MTDDLPRVTVATWSVINDPLAFLPPLDSFSSLNRIHLQFPLPTPPNRNRVSSLAGERGPKELTLTISEREISFSTGSDSPADSVVLSNAHRTIIINHIHTIMGDAFLGVINGGNNGGRNNYNNIGEYSINCGLIVLIHLAFSWYIGTPSIRHGSLVSVSNVPDYALVFSICMFLGLFPLFLLFLITVVTTKER